MMQPVFVLGCAHTGTTALARYLGSAPRWENYVSGKESPLLECDELLHRGADALRAICASRPRVRWVFKRPWAEESWEWLLEEFPDAAYLVCMKPFAACWESWTKDGSAAMRGIKSGTVDHAWGIWTQHMRWGSCLVAHAARAAWVDHGAFCRRPDLVDAQLREWRIRGAFDPSTIRPAAGLA